MRTVGIALLLLALLLIASNVGLFLQRWMREHHRSRNTIDSVRLVITMLVTFAALVLGLLVTASKNSFDEHTQVVRHFGTRLIELDFRLREYGPQADPIRAVLRRYTAAIEGALPTISSSFLLLLMLWLVIIFVTFGLASPRNGVIQVVILLSALSVASSLYLIVDLDSPFGGLLWVSSQPMRDALMHMDQPVQWPPP
jgi:uncharacterized membrane protein